jgi:hypothetical protein
MVHAGESSQREHLAISSFLIEFAGSWSSGDDTWLADEARDVIVQIAQLA